MPYKIRRELLSSQPIRLDSKTSVTWFPRFSLVAVPRTETKESGVQGVSFEFKNSYEIEAVLKCIHLLTEETQHVENHFCRVPIAHKY